MKRRLTLTSEHLSELTTDDLAAVNGGLPTQMCTGAYPTWNCAALVSLVTRVVTTTTG